jgi:hypothetical protein
MAQVEHMKMFGFFSAVFSGSLGSSTGSKKSRPA